MHYVVQKSDRTARRLPAILGVYPTRQDAERAIHEDAAVDGLRVARKRDAGPRMRVLEFGEIPNRTWYGVTRIEVT